MVNKAVSFELTMTDCLDKTSSIHVDLVGQITQNPTMYRYTEEPTKAQVSLTFNQDSIHLLRESEQTTEIEFNLNKTTNFKVYDSSTHLSGTVETLSMSNQKDFLLIHYRLFINEDLVSEQKLQLTLKEGDA